MAKETFSEIPRKTRTITPEQYAEISALGTCPWCGLVLEFRSKEGKRRTHGGSYLRCYNENCPGFGPGCKTTPGAKCKDEYYYVSSSSERVFSCDEIEEFEKARNRKNAVRPLGDVFSKKRAGLMNPIDIFPSREEESEIVALEREIEELSQKERQIFTEKERKAFLLKKLLDKKKLEDEIASLRSRKP